MWFSKNVTANTTSADSIHTESNMQMYKSQKPWEIYCTKSASHHICRQVFLCKSTFILQSSSNHTQRRRRTTFLSQLLPASCRQRQEKKALNMLKLRNMASRTTQFCHATRQKFVRGDVRAFSDFAADYRSKERSDKHRLVDAVSLLIN